MGNAAQKQGYEKYRWFFTSSGKLVVGGKNAEQNEELVQKLISSKKNYVVMHTKLPGSPFSIIQSEKINKKDLDESAIFTACFSRAWREKLKKIVVDIFNANQIIKPKNAKLGTFQVAGAIVHKAVELKLYLTKQKGKLRAVPFIKKESVLISPGNLSKEKTAEGLSKILKTDYQEVLQALPTGGFKPAKK